MFCVMIDSLYHIYVLTLVCCILKPSNSWILVYCNAYRITKLEELDNAANTFLLRFQQALCKFFFGFYWWTFSDLISYPPALLKRSPILTSSKFIESILKNNETRRLKSYVESGCINIDDAALSTRACKFTHQLFWSKVSQLMRKTFMF